MGEVLPGEAGGLRLAGENLVDLRTRTCPSCGDSMNRIEFLDAEDAATPRVMWSCDICETWQADSL